MPVYTLYLPYNRIPLFFNSTSPYRYGFCMFCNYSRMIRNSYEIAGPKLKNVKYNEYFNYKFCETCFDKYRIIRPSDEELLLRLHIIMLRKINKKINKHLPMCLSLLVSEFIKYPESYIDE